MWGFKTVSFSRYFWGQREVCFDWGESNLCLAKPCKKFSICFFIWSFRSTMFAIFMCLSSGIWRNWRSELFFSLLHPPQISPSARYMDKTMWKYLCPPHISSLCYSWSIPVHPWCCVHHIFNTVWSSSSINTASFSCVDIQCSAANTPWWIAPKATLGSCKPFAKAARQGKSSQSASLKWGWNPIASRGSGRRGESTAGAADVQAVNAKVWAAQTLPCPALPFHKNTTTRCCLLPHPSSPLPLPTASLTFL